MSNEEIPNQISEPLPPEITTQYSDVITEKPDISQGETWDTVQEITEKDIESPIESPKSVFAQAYEKVRNMEVVSNITYHVGLWWNGAMDKDIARLEKLKAAQEHKAGEHENSIAASAEAKNRLDTIRGGLQMGEGDEKVNADREAQQAALESRAAMHREKASYLDIELAKKIAIREQFESARTEARNTIVGRFESKIADNQTAIEYVNSQIGEIEANVEVGQRISADLQAKQEVLRGDLSNPALLEADKKSISVTIQEIGRRIQNIDTALTMQRAKIEQHTTKKDTLTQQSEKWRARIAKKQEGWGITKEAETAQPAMPEHTHEGIELRNEVQEEQSSSAPEKNAEQDPRAALLDQMQFIMSHSDFSMYRDPDSVERILAQGTPDQKLLLETSGFFTKLLAFLESRAEPEPETGKEEAVEQQSVSNQLEPTKLAHTYDELLDEFDNDPDIHTLLIPDRRKKIEQGEGTSEQRLLVKLLNFFEYLFKSLEIRPDSEKENQNNNSL